MTEPKTQGEFEVEIKWLKRSLIALSIFAIGDRSPEFLTFIIKVLELK